MGPQDRVTKSTKGSDRTNKKAACLMLFRGQISKVMVWATQSKTVGYSKTTDNTVVLYTNHTDVQCTERIVQDVAELIT